MGQAETTEICQDVRMDTTGLFIIGCLATSNSWAVAADMTIHPNYARSCKRKAKKYWAMAEEAAR